VDFSARNQESDSKIYRASGEKFRDLSGSPVAILKKRRRKHATMHHVNVHSAGCSMHGVFEEPS